MGTIDALVADESRWYAWTFDFTSPKPVLRLRRPTNAWHYSPCDAVGPLRVALDALRNVAPHVKDSVR